MNLNGRWTLYFCPQGEYEINSPSELKNSDIQSIMCSVPGNVELDLSEAGILPKDLYMGENICLAEKYELYEWWYEKTFTAPSAPDAEHKMTLCFEAVDCCAEYYLNGEKIGESRNMFIPHTFDVTGLLKYECENTIHVHIRSACLEADKYDTEPNMAFLTNSTLKQAEALHIRKAPHSYGWDIMPRAVSAGIWRGVELKCEQIQDFKYMYFVLNKLDGKDGRVKLIFDSNIRHELLREGVQFKINGFCGDSCFEEVAVIKTKGGYFPIEIKNIKLWWPRYYGEQNRYNITVEVTDKRGNLLIKKNLMQGFRTLQLKRTDVVCDGGSFEFIINGVKIMAVGTNWVPMDAYHSRDRERYAKALELAEEVGVNIIRCWGGNVYEEQEFFDFCNEKGIMVWQDFAMACNQYPYSGDFIENFTEEVISVVSRYRHNECIVLWSGDNENDERLAMNNINPESNTITRDLLPSLITRFDPCRPYIASSPYIGGEAFEKGLRKCSEAHLWGPRDYFKSDYYRLSEAYFVSEIGYHGCPSVESVRKFIEPEYVWPYTNNPQWNLHSSDQTNDDKRTMIMHKQVLELFGEVPDNPEDYVIASQISQAEAKKYFIERVRAQMSRMGGVIWWNLLDGWPQMSDAVVDYYYDKKLAFDYIKRSSRDFIVMIDEMAAWGYPVLCANSSLKTYKGHVKITDVDTGKIHFESDFEALPNMNTSLGKIPMMYSDKGMFLIEWETECGQKHFNTYLYGAPKYSLEQYKKWLEILKNI